MNISDAESKINPASAPERDDLPLVSVCIPSYNGADTINDTIRSVLSQTYSNIEIIVCDDKSSDNTVDVVKSIEDKRITVKINPENSGLVGNMNRCIDSANGKYVKVLCQDDILHPKMIELQVRAFLENDGVSIVTCASSVIDSRDNIVSKRQVYRSDRRIDGIRFARKTLNGRNYYGEPCCHLYDTDKAKKAGLFSQPELFYCTDWDAGIRMSYAGDLYYISDTLASFRIINDSTTSKMSKNNDPRITENPALLYEYHKKLGKMRLGGFHELKFKLMVRLYAAARNIIIRKVNR